jgi:hypothetical protein
MLSPVVLVFLREKRLKFLGFECWKSEAFIVIAGNNFEQGKLLME